jgi:DNA polymerase-3 subunit epsilon
MDFIAVDVETANADLASICQIGAVTFENGKYIDRWSTLVDPDDFFDGMNISVHGITEDDVKGSPTWPTVVPELNELLSGSIVACHTHFDRVATTLANEQHGLPPFGCQWLDTAKVVRRAWPDRFAAKGYGIRKVAKFLDIEFKHHDALEDARAAGEILFKACEHTGLTLDNWLHRVRQPIDSSSSGSITREGDTEGALFGNVAVFTGALSIPRREAANLAAKVGCDVGASVTKKTTLLVVGDQDVTKLAGKQKSSKHLKAEKLISSGQPIRILRESDFRRLGGLAENG